ncbi:DedA family protein [Nocardioides litoris]|uniref:DedA family protein n=1 Tax=Nocardioides litoris TaxID=1926648 RepID=UPI001120D060|nr:VTT domain-containing protein [Nocardioides litoris]
MDSGGAADAATADPPSTHRRFRPWEGEAQRADKVLVALIVARGVYGLAMVPLIPLMLDPHPVLIQLISGSSIADVVVGARVRVGDVSWPVAILAGLPLWVLTDWIYWWAGRRWGDRALVALLSRSGRPDAHARAKRVEQVMHRLGPSAVLLAWFLPVPSFLVYAAAGTARMRLWVFLVLDVLGTALTVAILVTLGYLVGRRAVDLVEAFNRYAALTAVALVVLLVLVHLVRRRSDRRAARRAGSSGGA